MKYLNFIICLLLTSLCFGQKSKIHGIIKDTSSDLAYYPVAIELFADTNKISSTMCSKAGEFEFNDLAPGIYQLIFSRIGGRPEKRNGVKVMEGQITEVYIKYPGPCLYNYSKSHKPQCPKNPSDRLIPIVYGMPNQKTLQRAKEGKIYLAGCVLTGCDPRYYCPVHKLEL